MSGRVTNIQIEPAHGGHARTPYFDEGQVRDLARELDKSPGEIRRALENLRKRGLII